MLLCLWRDPASLVMSFVLPGIVFAIFAVIFSGASGGELAIRVAVADVAERPSSSFVADLFSNKKITRVSLASDSRESVLRAVREGSADVGLVIHRPILPPTRSGTGERAPFEIITDPSKEIASSLLAGTVQQALSKALQPAAQGIDMIEQTPAIAGAGSVTAAGYYAGAVAMMFLLFSALTGASTYVEEMESGLMARISLGIGGAGIVIDGKFMFLVLQGVLQVAVVFLVAWLGFKLDLPSALIPWAITTLAAAIAAAGLALAFVTLCETKKQAETIGQMLVLIISAIGGSMVPRFLMPAEVQALGWITPNTWALEAYASAFWRDDPTTTLMVYWAVLVAMGLAGLIIARIQAVRRRQRF
jgi:ABC-2 type transport system permease protein